MSLLAWMPELSVHALVHLTVVGTVVYAAALAALRLAHGVRPRRRYALAALAFAAAVVLPLGLVAKRAGTSPAAEAAVRTEQRPEDLRPIAESPLTWRLPRGLAIALPLVWIAGIAVQGIRGVTAGLALGRARRAWRPAASRHRRLLGWPDGVPLYVGLPGPAASSPPADTAGWGPLDRYLGFNPRIEVVIAPGERRVRIEGRELSGDAVDRWLHSRSPEEKAEIVRRALQSGRDPTGRADPSLLAWFLRKRLPRFSGAVSGLYFAVDGASGASPERWARIAREAPEAILGNAANSLFPEVPEALGIEPLEDGFRAPIVSDVESLFVSGTLDSNAPPYQAEEMRWGFTRAAHLIVENAGHEDMLDHPEVVSVLFDFFSGQDVRDRRVALPAPRFLSVEEAIEQRLGGR